MNSGPQTPLPSQPSPEKHYIRVDAPQSNPYQVQMPKIGDRVGPNRIVELIGEGGMANVFKVWHEGLEVTRALKILKNASDKEARERFFTEAKILADIHYPNIVEIHNIGYWEQKTPFLEMEFVDGSSIRQLLTERNRLPLQVALTIAYFTCQSLHYAHTKDYTLYGKVYKGLIHRDIKPDNIIVSKDGIVKLMDFGIARPSEVSLHTIGGKVMGSLAYLSPEQLDGKDIDHRSDIFSLGSVLYEMITGQRAYPQKTISELVRHKSKGEYAPIDSFDIDIPASLKDVIDRSMSLNLMIRYGTAAEFGSALYAEFRNISDRSPSDVLYYFTKNIDLPPPSSGRFKKKKRFSNPLFITLATVGAGLLLLAVIWGTLKITGLLP
jgi:serine/threonine-protein kinase